MQSGAEPAAWRCSPEAGGAQGCAGTGGSEANAPVGYFCSWLEEDEGELVGRVRDAVKGFCHRAGQKRAVWCWW